MQSAEDVGKARGVGRVESWARNRASAKCPSTTVLSNVLFVRNLRAAVKDENKHIGYKYKYKTNHRPTWRALLESSTSALRRDGA